MHTATLGFIEIQECKHPQSELSQVSPKPKDKVTLRSTKIQKHESHHSKQPQVSLKPTEIRKNKISSSKMDKVTLGLTKI